MRSGTGLQPDQRRRHVRGIGQQLPLCELLLHKHLPGRAESYQMKRRLAQVYANRMYLHIDDPPSKKLPPRSSDKPEESSGGPSH